MEFWFERGSEKIQLPVNPSSINGILPTAFDDVSIVGEKEHTVFNTKGLDEYSFSSHFPLVYAPYCEIKPKMKPWDYFNKLKSWCDGEPIKFRVTGTKINQNVTIRSLTFDIRSGPEDVYYDIQLKEHNPIAIKKVTANKTSNKRQSVSKPTPPKSYTVKSGDTLWNIAKKYYGNGNKYTIIYNANKGTIGKNPNKITPGQKLVIPSA